MFLLVRQSSSLCITSGWLLIIVDENVDRVCVGERAGLGRGVVTMLMINRTVEVF